MKKVILTLLLLTAVSFVSLAQSVITVTGDITSNTTWTSNNVYILNGFVYVTNNSTLTIQPGTLIKGDKASKGSLIITRGSKILADGTASQPIVFTSNEPSGLRSYGDWGGIIICGRAPLNDPAGERIVEGGVDAAKGTYGGTDPNDDSGILRYVRIEFPGIAFMPNNEINGLTLGAVGKATVIDYIQISYAGDDAFECFGGTVNLKHLISYRTLDDDFDTDFGYNGKCQFLVAQRDSNVADVSGSNGFESDNDATGTTNSPFTSPVYSNVSIIGPMIGNGTMISSNFKRGAHLRRSTKTSIFNSVITGFPTGLLIDGVNCENAAVNNELNFRSNVIAGCPTPLAVASSSSWDISSWYNQSGNNNSILPNASDIMLADAYNYDGPLFTPQNGSPLLSGADFSYTQLNDPYFDIVNFRGAFGTTDWTAGWANWDAQNTDYTTISENEVIESVLIYPNPITDNSSIQFTLKRSGSISLNVVDLAGRTVYSKQGGFMSTGRQTVGLDLNGLSSGIYTLQLITDSGSVSARISIR